MTGNLGIISSFFQMLKRSVKRKVLSYSKHLAYLIKVFTLVYGLYAILHLSMQKCATMLTPLGSDATQWKGECKNIKQLASTLITQPIKTDDL